MARRLALSALAALLIGAAPPQIGYTGPIIDMHMHAYPADAQGPPIVVICAPYDDMPTRDPRQSDAAYAADTFKVARCRHPIRSARTDDDLRDRSIAMLRRFDITAVTGGPLIARWREAGGDRIIPSLELGLADAPPLTRIRALAKSGAVRMIGELTTQYEGVSPDDPRLEPYWALAEELTCPSASTWVRVRPARRISARRNTG